MSAADIIGPVVYQVWVNGVYYNQAANFIIEDAQLVQEYGQHDLFYLRMEVPSNQAANISTMSIWPDDVPVEVVWGRAPDLRTFYGYVNHHEIDSAADSGTNNLQLTYVLIGTSGVMNNAVHKRWEGVTPTYIARMIAAKYNLRAVTSPSVVGLDYAVQVGESDFQFLNRLAFETGYRFWVSGATLYFISPLVAIEGLGQSAIPEFTQTKSITMLDTCRFFKYLKGKNLPGAVQAQRTIYGIDHHGDSGTVFTATTPNTNSSRVAIKTDFAAQAFIDAQLRVDAWASLAQFWIGASAQFYGYTRIYPGKLVQLAGGGLPDGAQGYWLVAHATHNLLSSWTGLGSRDRFVTDVILLRSEENKSAVLANTLPVSPEFATMTLTSSGWSSDAQVGVNLR